MKKHLELYLSELEDERAFLKKNAQLQASLTKPIIQQQFRSLSKRIAATKNQLSKLKGESAE